MLALEVAILSERGGRNYNEDACGHWHTPGELLCVLADGAGGHGGGDIAARLVVERMLQAFAERPGVDGQALENLVRDANRNVIAARVPATERANMHATVVSLVIDFMQHRASWAHAGDSRLYWFRGGQVLTQTRDHSLVQALVDAGMLAADQARTHPKRSELRSALGVDSAALQVDHSGQPRPVQAGDVFLLCSDGVWEHVAEQRLEATLREAATPRAWLDALEREVGAATQDKASHDNFTAMAVWARGADAH